MLAAGATLGTLVVVELVATLWLLRLADEQSFIRYASLRQLQQRFGDDLLTLAAEHGRTPYSPHRYLGYYPTPGYERPPNRHNRLGFRGEEITTPKPPGEFRIVCLGGSTTYTSAVLDWRSSYPALLQEELRRAGFAQVTVVNGGSAGWASLESLINLELRVLPLEPDLIVVYHGINDVHPRLVWPPEAYRADNSGKRVPNVSALVMPSVFEHSTALRWFLIRIGRVQPHASFRRTVDLAAPTYYGDLFEEQKLAGTYPSGIFREVPARRMLEVNRPVWFRQNLVDIIALARRHDVVPVLSTFAFSPAFPGVPTVSSEEYRAALGETNDVVREVAADEGVPLIDMHGQFPRSPRYFRDGIHVTEEGARLKARIVARELVEQGLLPGAPGARP